MPRVSTIATHKQHDRIEKAMLDGVPVRQIAKQFKVSARAVQDHKRHIAERTRQALEARNVRTIDYLQELEELRQVAIKELREAQASDPVNKPLLFTALKHAGDFTERLARFTGQSLEKTGGTTNIQVNLFEVMPIVRATLARYPDAMAAVQKAIADARRGNGQS